MGRNKAFYKPGVPQKADLKGQGTLKDLFPKASADFVKAKYINKKPGIACISITSFLLHKEENPKNIEKALKEIGQTLDMEIIRLFDDIPYGKSGILRIYGAGKIICNR